MSCVGGIARGVELFENRERAVQVTLRDGPGAALRDEPTEREMTEAGLVALAEQIEERRTLREVVIRVGRASFLGVQRAAQPQILAPRRRRDRRIEIAGGA